MDDHRPLDTALSRRRPIPSNPGPPNANAVYTYRDASGELRSGEIDLHIGKTETPLPAPGVSLLYQPDGSWAALGGYAQFTQEAPSWSGPGPDPSTALVAETTHFRVPGHKPRSRTVGYLCMGCHGAWVNEDGAGRCPHCAARAHGSEQYQIAARVAAERRAWAEHAQRTSEHILADTECLRQLSDRIAAVACARARVSIGERRSHQTRSDLAGASATMHNAATPCRHAVTDNVTTSLGRVLMCCDCGMHIDGNPGDARVK